MSKATRAWEVLAGPSPPQVLPALPEYVGGEVCAFKNGLLVAVPTNTFYGFAADACGVMVAASTNSFLGDAINKIYWIKDRYSMNPLALCLAHPDEFEKYSVTKHLPEGLLKEMFPGPVTDVLSRGGRDIWRSHFSNKCSVSEQSSTIRILEFESLWASCARVF
ncbi:hypothetical protein L7F22_042799 [Adiantum nelumboides]|nr:hypothetical protein [Adiantum nelumboides]